MKESAILYSGGTDSTCAAALMAGEFERIHLITYRRFGLSLIDNSGVNVERLRNKFGEGRFIHRIINIDKIFKEVAYGGYFHYLSRYGFFLLSTCGMCKLAMHLRTLIYCLENKIKYACDGANKNMIYFPDQTPGFIDEITKLYSQYGITYSTPVFEFEHPQNLGWLDKLGLNIPSLHEENHGPQSQAATTGEILNKMDILPLKNVKGTKLDRRMQGRCFQLILFNIFAHQYAIPLHGFIKYKHTSLNFFKEKIGDCKRLIEEYLKKNKKSSLFKLLE